MINNCSLFYFHLYSPSPVARKLLAIQVERVTGYTCHAAASGIEAVNILLELMKNGGTSFDAILIDHAMTHSSSLKEVREHSTAHHTTPHHSISRTSTCVLPILDHSAIKCVPRLRIIGVLCTPLPYLHLSSSSLFYSCPLFTPHKLPRQWHFTHSMIAPPTPSHHLTPPLSHFTSLHSATTGQRESESGRACYSSCHQTVRIHGSHHRHVRLNRRSHGRVEN